LGGVTVHEFFGDLWDVGADLRVITTNGDVDRRGAAVMGRGCALEAKARVPGIEYRFAGLLERHGNRVMRLAKLPDGSHLASFPTQLGSDGRAPRSASSSSFFEDGQHSEPVKGGNLRRVAAGFAQNLLQNPPSHGSRLPYVLAALFVRDVDHTSATHAPVLVLLNHTILS
jgi:hypothetical protein